RLDVFLRLVVEIGHGELSSERPECFSAAPSDRIFIGNADDEAFLALEQLGLYDGNHGGNPLVLGFECFRLEITLGNILTSLRARGLIFRSLTCANSATVGLQKGSDLECTLS